jgi:hypothetical protein
MQDFFIIVAIILKKKELTIAFTKLIQKNHKEKPLGKLHSTK